MHPSFNIKQPWVIISISIINSVIGVFGGFACLSNPCIHGVCLDGLNTTYSCYCIDGYTGVQCQTNWDECWSSPCRNGATCIDGIAEFNCSCPSGFAGDLCEEDVDECESSPCLNNGTCLDVTNGYICSCLPGYSGTHCEIDIAVCNATNETRCSNGGVCVEGPGVTFSCRCLPGWGGFYCESEIDECMSSPCLNGGVCVDLLADYACACLFGFTGRNCEEEVQACENNPCRNDALCLTEDDRATCYCVPDYHGELCQYQYDECQLGPRCMNGGTCIDGIDNFTCSCPPALTGVLCECLIQEDDELDCGYVSPSPITAIYSSSTQGNLTQFSSTLTPSAQTAVPNIYSTEFSTTIITDTTIFQNISLRTTLEASSMPSTGETTFITSAPTFRTTRIDTTTEQITSAETETPTMITKDIGSTLSVETASTTIFETVSSETTFRTEPTVGRTSFDVSTIPQIALTTLTIEQTVTPIVTLIPSETTQKLYTETTIFPSISTFLTEEPDGGQTVTITREPHFQNFTTPYTALEDCSKVENGCQNGGTCVFGSMGYKCVCPFDAEGAFCEIRLGIKNAAFGGDSFISHRLNNLTNISLDFKARTLSPNGLLFFVNVDSTYMTVYLENGYLKFKFSCGFQTMLLSELEIPVNNGFDININAKLDFLKDRNHCNASVSLNNTSTMAGDQVALTEKLVKPIGWLHFGSIPQEVLRADIHNYGFIGCMTDLKISGKKVNIFKDAEDGFGVSECSSLVCLSSPCANGGVCMSTNDSWSCHCKNGYFGIMCELSICDNNPCLFGGTCVPFTGSGYICLCPFGKHGHYCENDLEITEPNFSSSVHGLSSYAAYSIPEGISRNMEIKFKFTPKIMDQISILMFMGQKGFHDSFADHMAVSFVKGYIMLTWNLGSGPRRIFTTRAIEPGKNSYLVRIGHFGRRAWLAVDNLGNITGRSPGNLVQLDVFPLLYLGGHESFNFSTLPHDLPLHVGFSGCIFDVELKSGSVVVPLQVSKQVVGRAVGQCDTSECYQGICHNGGACLHHGSTFMCLCQDQWFGPVCADKQNPCDSSANQCASGSTCFPLMTGYECDCPIGKTGKYCDNDENITDVSFSGKRSYLSLGHIEIDGASFNFEFQIRPLHTKGLILFIGKPTSFLCVSIQNGLLELTILTVKRKISSNDVLILRSNKLLALGVWYKVLFGVYGRKVYLSVDNVLNTGTIGSGDSLTISGEKLYLGGLPDLSVLPEFAMLSLPLAFTGCMRIFSIDSKRIPLTSEGIKRGRNIGDCDGTPCGGDYCENGGTCWLDSGIRPRCECPEPYFGDKCHEYPECSQKLCHDRGRCANSKCVCKVGWGGAFCEKSIEVNVPKFGGNSYLVIGNTKDKKRNIKDFNVNNLFVNFTTAKKNGLLLWSTCRQVDKHFFGIGIDRGHLKIVHSLKNFNETTVEIPNIGFISDGLWHTLKITFNPFSTEFDDRIIDLNDDGFSLYSHEYFYLGGTKDSSATSREIRKIFQSNFEGCIEAFRVNNDSIIRDFSKYDGESIETCNILD